MACPLDDNQDEYIKSFPNKFLVLNVLETASQASVSEAECHSENGQIMNREIAKQYGGLNGTLRNRFQMLTKHYLL